MASFHNQLTILAILAGSALCRAEPDILNCVVGCPSRTDALTGGFGGPAEMLSHEGIDSAMSVTSIYQQNVDGGISTHRRAGRWAGSYDLELTGNFERLLGLSGGRLYTHGEGWWSRSAGINSPAVGSAFNVNADAMEQDALVVTELWYEQALFDRTLLVRFGKLDMTGGFQCRGCPVSFDGCTYANDETAQFLNGALVNDPTIPFPDYGLGIIFHYQPADAAYLSIGAADAQADHRQSGFQTAFTGPDYFFYIAETGWTPRLASPKGPLQGAYRIGLWNDPRPKTNADSDRMKRDDLGFYVSCDQSLVRETSDPNDTRGLGVFARYGYAPGATNDITGFWSVGLQYQGLIEGRDDDVAAIGWAQGFFSNGASATYPADSESVVEAYYRICVAGWLDASPSIQYIRHPGGASTIDHATVLALRAQIRI
jgi:porin